MPGGSAAGTRLGGKARSFGSSASSTAGDLSPAATLTVSPLLKSLTQPPSGAAPKSATPMPPAVLKGPPLPPYSQVELPAPSASGSASSAPVEPLPMT